jgi:predicted nucleotide-binding protein (sugar kinase/HSP70/actin superfamily)
MTDRFWISGAQIEEIIDSLRHGDIVTFIKTVQKIIDDQYLGTLIDQKKQRVCITGGVRHG